jgi:PhzF family phenazine biosynthesis protein
MSERAAYIVNAFTARGEHGNPAGVVLDADDLHEDQMLAIAQQVGLSETAFVSKGNDAATRVRFFTPTEEVALCGHATIAAWSLLKSLKRVSNGNHIQQTIAGNLGVTIRDDITFMEQTPPRFYETVSTNIITELLGIETDDLHPTLPSQLVSTGLKDVMVPVRDAEVLERLQPQTEAIKAFSRQHDSYSLHVFALTQGESLASARNFDPAHGIPEECATGTSNGGLLCYLNQQGVLPTQDIYRVEQGRAMGQLSYIYGRFVDQTVWIGGNATLMAQRPI